MVTLSVATLNISSGHFYSSYGPLKQHLGGGSTWQYLVIFDLHRPSTTCETTEIRSEGTLDPLPPPSELEDAWATGDWVNIKVVRTVETKDIIVKHWYIASSYVTFHQSIIINTFWTHYRSHCNSIIAIQTGSLGLRPSRPLEMEAAIICKGNGWTPARNYSTMGLSLISAWQKIIQYIL